MLLFGSKQKLIMFFEIISILSICVAMSVFLSTMITNKTDMVEIKFKPNIKVTNDGKTINCGRRYDEYVMALLLGLFVSVKNIRKLGTM